MSSARNYRGKFMHCSRNEWSASDSCRLCLPSVCISESNTPNTLLVDNQNLSPSSL